MEFKTNVQATCIYLTLLAVVALQGTAFSQATDTQPVRFKVLCYNLRFGELASLEELAGFIREHKPDFVALQEVDCGTYRDRAPKQHGKDFATELGFRTGMLSAYGKTIPYAGGYYGIAILSKYPLAKVERIFLPKTANGKEQRAVLVAHVEYRDGAYITFASTHLDYTNTEERQVQVEALKDVLQNEPHPVIVGGDFNARPESTEIARGMADWSVLSNLEPTVPANDPRSTIDYLFGYPADRWHVVNSTTHRVSLSDHLPVEAVVELR